MIANSKIQSLKQVILKESLSNEDLCLLFSDLLFDQKTNMLEELKKELRKGEESEFRRLDLDKIYNKALETYTNSK
jgi:hypothetical protein